ncbi:ATP-binding cassette domain-containing protein [Cupriavidus basilensis]
MKRDIILATDALTLRRGGHAVLSDVRLAVVRARVTALVGPAGSGKSALLGVLSGSCAAMQRHGQAEWAQHRRPVTAGTEPARGLVCRPRRAAI